MSKPESLKPLSGEADHENIMKRAVFVPMPRIIDEAPRTTEDRLSFLLKHHEGHRLQVHENIRRQYHLQLSRKASRRGSKGLHASDERTTGSEDNEESAAAAAVYEVVADLQQPFKSSANEDPYIRAPGSRTSTGQPPTQYNNRAFDDNNELKQLLQQYDDRTIATKKAREGWLRREQEKNGTLRTGNGSPAKQLGAAESISTSSRVPTTTSIPVRGTPDPAITTTKTATPSNALPLAKSTAARNEAAVQQNSGVSMTDNNVSTDPRKRKYPFGDGIKHSQKPGHEPKLKRSTTEAPLQSVTNVNPVVGALASAKSKSTPIWAQKRRPSLIVDTSGGPGGGPISTTSTSAALTSASTNGLRSAPATPGGSREPAKPARLPAWAKAKPTASANEASSDPRQTYATSKAVTISSNVPMQATLGASVAPTATMTNSSGQTQGSKDLRTLASASTQVDAARDPRKKLAPQPPQPPRKAADPYARRW